jgi:AcrR family transcriptional regulator
MVKRASSASQEVSESTRKRLCDAAVEEFTTAGYFATDTNKIAIRAKMSPGSFYRHFKNKAEIFAEVFERETREEAQHVLDGVLQALHQGRTLLEVAGVFADILIRSRARLNKIRVQAEILMRSDEQVLVAKKRVREDAVSKAMLFSKGVYGKTPCEDQIHVHMHVINHLADAMACDELDMNSPRGVYAKQLIVWHYISFVLAEWPPGQPELLLQSAAPVAMEGAH